MATSVSFQWNPVTDSNLAGYKLYYQADSSAVPFSGTGATQGSAPVNVGNVTSATVSGLDPSRPYYFAVTAYSTTGIESPYSSIISIPELLPPTTAITYPANNSTASGTVSVSASASDNVGVTKVEFYVNGALQASDTSTPYVFSWNASTLAPGAYTLSTKAYDAAGNVGQSGNVSVNVVNDTTPPTVTVTSPANNATVNGTTAITASSSDNVGVTKVEFYENGVLLSATNVAPYSYNWDTSTLANGSYTLTAKAYDAAGNVRQSAGVVVTAYTPPPIVTLSSPVSGSAAVEAAAGNTSISRVEYYVDGALQSSDTTAPYIFSWNTSALAYGNNTLTARVYDVSGNIVKSPTFTYTVSDQMTVSGTMVL